MCLAEWPPAQTNDIGMLKWAGRSFALKGSHERVLSAATDVTEESLADEGTGLALETLASARSMAEVITPRATASL